MRVLAHPDDESSGTGGALAKCAAEGVATYLVTATRGERGRFRDSKESPGPDIVGKAGEAELLAAATELCVEGLHRELPYIAGRYRSRTPAVVPAGRRGRYHPQARARETRGRLEATGPRKWPSDDAVREGAGFPDRCTMPA